MQRIILHKIIPDAENHLLNLYFRLYLKAFTSHMRRQGFFFTLDYSYEMAYLNRQILSFEVVFYNSQAAEASPNFDNLVLNLNEATVKLTFQELNTATGRYLEGNIKELIKALKEVHETSWMDFDKLPFFIANKTKPKTTRIQDSGESMRTFKAVILVKLDEEYTREYEYAPLLFTYIAEALSAEITRLLHQQYACALHNTSNLYENSVAYRVWTINFGSHIERRDIATYIEQQLTNLDGNAFVRSLVRYTQNDLQQSLLSDLTYRRRFRETRVIAGMEAWRQFTTEKNIHDILTHMRLSVNDLIGEVALTESISDYLFKPRPAQDN